MAVTFDNRAILLLFNPEFVVACTLEELAAVLQHEVHHLLFGHLTLDPADFEDPVALTIAEEVTVNEWIRGPLPGQPMLLEHYPMLPPREDTQQRYRRLQQHQKHLPRRSRNTVHANTLDDHSVWEQARQQGVLGQMVVKVSAVRAAQELTSAQWNSLPHDLQTAVTTLCRSPQPGGVREALRPPARVARCPWRQALSRYLGQLLETRPMHNRLPRRFPHLIGVVPGQYRHPRQPHVMAVIDTSGSISSELLEQIAAELLSLGRWTRTTVVECDADIRNVYPFRRRLTQVRGRGGTDFRPALAPEFLQTVRPDVVVYFTDGRGPAPPQSPRIPVVWCLTPCGTPPTDWGRVIRMSL